MIRDECDNIQHNKHIKRETSDLRAVEVADEMNNE